VVCRLKQKKRFCVAIGGRPDQFGHFIETGASGTTFFVDPKQRLIIIMMIQVPAPANSFYRRAVRYLAYQALSDSD
jgi:CubicO group peptidase (beta-lactamase class C family)